MIGEVLGGMRIWTIDKYIEFTGNLSKPKVKKKIFLKLANVEKDKEEENSWAKRLGFYLKVLLFFIFVFFYNSLWVYIKYLGKWDD